MSAESVSRKSPPTVLKDALKRERRANRRLRALIDELREEIRQQREEGQQYRRDLDVQFKRLAQLQAEVDLMKAARKSTLQAPDAKA
jgi:hypothetical protein